MKHSFGALEWQVFDKSMNCMLKRDLHADNQIKTNEPEPTVLENREINQQILSGHTHLWGLKWIVCRKLYA